MIHPGLLRNFTFFDPFYDDADIHVNCRQAASLLNLSIPAWRTLLDSLSPNDQGLICRTGAQGAAKTVAAVELSRQRVHAFAKPDCLTAARVTVRRPIDIDDGGRLGFGPADRRGL
jgi:hypothetical protein